MAKRRSNPLSEENIKRIDRDAGPNNTATHGFQVYIQRQGAVHTKFFADRLNGGRNKARSAARAYRDQLKAQLPPPTSPIQRHYKAKSNTGVRGLSYRQRRNRDGSFAKYIQVHTRPSRGQVVNIHLRYTEATHQEVLEKAIALRQEATRRRITADAAIAQTAEQRAEKRKLHKDALAKKAPAGKVKKTPKKKPKP